MTTVAVIIARGGSQRLPTKNTLPFHGLPLVAHKIKQLHRCRMVSEVIVGSEDEKILTEARIMGATALPRAPEFCDEKSRSWNDVIYDMVTRIHGDVVLWAHCTNPCIRPETYDEAIRRYALSTKDSLIGVTAVRNHFWWNSKPLNFDPQAPSHVPAAGVQPLYFQNGGIFIAARVAMARWRYVYGPDPELFEIPEREAVDIDTREDYEQALRLYKP
jgi:CMP-N-acetylneuraminic acid synthetase